MGKNIDDKAKAPAKADLTLERKERREKLRELAADLPWDPEALRYMLVALIDEITALDSDAQGG